LQDGTDNAAVTMRWTLPLGKLPPKSESSDWNDVSNLAISLIMSLKNRESVRQTIAVVPVTALGVIQQL
jgi:hypothetical protein